MPRSAHQPNRLSSGERSWNLFLAFILTTYGVAGLVTHTLKFSQRGRLLVFLEGGSAWLMSLALLVGACVFVSWVIDHYDTRNNEIYYRIFRWIATYLGWALVASSLILHLYVGFTK
ncbi:hypothetical protein B0B52_10560 [Polaromonas sp. A23]|nr:hypothetical protein B0B52_10560 [Polaromonas sp. A23]